MFDVNEPSTFEEIVPWFTAARQALPTDVVFVLVGNKLDTPRESTNGTHRAAVMFEQGSMLAESIGAEYFECSAKTGVNVDSIFKHISKRCLEVALGSTASAVDSGVSRPANAHRASYWPCSLL